MAGSFWSGGEMENGEPSRRKKRGVLNGVEWRRNRWSTAGGGRGKEVKVELLRPKKVWDVKIRGYGVEELGRRWRSVGEAKRKVWMNEGGGGMWRNREERMRIRGEWRNEVDQSYR